MRLILGAACFALAGCQLTSAERDTPAPIPQVPLTAEESLAAAFELAAASANVETNAVSEQITAQAGTTDVAAQKTGLLGLLKPKDEAAEPIAVPSVLTGSDIEVVDSSIAPAAEVVEITDALQDVPDPELEPDLEPDLEIVEGEPSEPLTEVSSGPVVAQVAPQKAGLFGLLKADPGRTSARQVALQADVPAQTSEIVAADTERTAVDIEAASETVVEAAVPADEDVEKTPLFGFLKPADGGGRGRVQSTVAVGETVGFGDVGITCETRKSDFGQQVDQFPRDGHATWRLYDTEPTSTARRTQYITGFKDGCARQITASLVIFGTPSLHEVHRYSGARSNVSWSKADNVYEDIKAKACGVGRKKPCPENKIDSLEDKLAFVSVYPTFGATSGWMELLLHNGRLQSQEMR
jgi:hypothetical protein